MKPQDWFSDVLEFHRKFWPDRIGSTPRLPVISTQARRVRLIEEEYRELLRTMQKGDLPAIAQECGDLIYTVIGCAVSLGIDLRPVWDAIHQSNMAKTTPVPGADKTPKPPGWQPPDIAGVLARQHPIDGVEL